VNFSRFRFWCRIIPLPVSPWTQCRGGRYADDSAADSDALIAEKAPRATRRQAIDIQAAILAALRKWNGKMVIGEGSPARW
jgi:hypothetical protein